jgi:site-specific DNA recombinase
MNAVVYCRVSTKEQVQNLSLTIQQTRCVDYCTHNGWSVLRVFKDEGESAKTADRPAFRQMVAFCKVRKNEVGFVVVHDLSRFSRQMEDQVAVIADLEQAGVKLRSVSENVDETAAGKLMRNIYGAFNQFDNDRKGERTKLGMQKAASIGRFPFKAPLGYINIRQQNGANLFPDPQRAPLVQKAFELYAAGTHTRTQVLKTITSLGLRSGAGKVLTPQSFENLLRNPIYAGWVCIPSWNVKCRGTFEPIVSEELFERVQEIIEGNRLAITPHQRNHPDFPLRVFVSCAKCGEPLTGSWSKGRSKRYPYYRCRKPSCLAVKIGRDALESAFAGLLEQLKPDPAYSQVFRAIVQQVWNNNEKESEALLRAIRRRLSQFTERKNKLVDALLDGRFDQRTYDEQIARLDVEVEQAEKQLREAELERMDIEAVLAFADKLLSRPSQLWREASLEQKQRLQKVFFPDGLTFSGEEFGTAVNTSFFSVLSVFQDTKSNLASPTGFEPVLPP